MWLFNLQKWYVGRMRSSSAWWVWLPVYAVYSMNSFVGHICEYLIYIYIYIYLLTLSLSLSLLYHRYMYAKLACGLSNIETTIFDLPYNILFLGMIILQLFVRVGSALNKAELALALPFMPCSMM